MTNGDLSTNRCGAAYLRKPRSSRRFSIPPDPTPRWIYADRLEEQGSPRAELFRIQHALTQSIDVPNRPALEARQQQLLNAGAPPAMVTVTDCHGIEFALLPAGTFLMGSPHDEVKRFPNEHRRRVVIKRPCLMSLHPITQRQYGEVQHAQRSYFARQGRGAFYVYGRRTSDLPAESIAWSDAAEFCNRWSAHTGWRPYYTIVSGVERSAPDGGAGGRSTLLVQRVEIAGGDGYRLPTEAEWEYACRAGPNSAWGFGNDERQLGQFAYFSPSLIDDEAQPVGQLRPSAFSLYDMHGNVWEWC